MKRKEFNKVISEANAKHLEQNATKAERLLCEGLLYYGIDFEFQKPLYSKDTCYIADFFIIGKNLIVELDGSAHKGKEKQDEQRSQKIRKRHRYQTIRFTNKQVFSHLESVINKINSYGIEPYKKATRKPKKAKQKYTKRQQFIIDYCKKNKIKCTPEILNG